MLFAIITAVLAYNKAKETGRSGLLWAVIGVSVFIGTQLLVGFGAALFFGLGIGLFDWGETLIDDYSVAINVVAIVAAFGASWALLRYLGRQSHSEPQYSIPPPPPAFAVSPTDDVNDNKAE